MYFNQRKSKFSFQTLCGYLLVAIQLYFIAFLLFEAIFFTFKLVNYDVLECIYDLLALSIEDKSTFKGPFNLTTSKSIRAYCWSNGSQKKAYKIYAGGYAFKTLRNEDYLSNDYLDQKVKEKKIFRIASFLVYILLGCQIVMFLLHRKLNTYHPIIKKLRERNIVNFGIEDRSEIAAQVVSLFQSSQRRYLLVLVVKLAYNLLLVFTICLIKLILFGQYVNLNWSDSDILYQILQIPGPAKFESIEKNDIYSMPAWGTPAKLDFVFSFLWFAYLGALSMYLLLIFCRLIQFSLPSLRTSSIVSIVGDSTESLIEQLNERACDYYFLHKLARNVDPFWFNSLVNYISYNISKETYSHRNGDDQYSDQASPNTNTNKIIEKLKEVQSKCEEFEKQSDESKLQDKLNDEIKLRIESHNKSKLADLEDNPDKEKTDLFRLNGKTVRNQNEEQEQEQVNVQITKAVLHNSDIINETD